MGSDGTPDLLYYTRLPSHTVQIPTLILVVGEGTRRTFVPRGQDDVSGGRIVAPSRPRNRASLNPSETRTTSYPVLSPVGHLPSFSVESHVVVLLNRSSWPASDRLIQKRGLHSSVRGSQSVDSRSLRVCGLSALRTYRQSTPNLGHWRPRGELRVFDTPKGTSTARDIGVDPVTVT